VDFEELGNNLCANMAALNDAMPTTQEVTDACIAVAPAMQQAWEQCLADDALWAMRSARRGILIPSRLCRQLRPKQQFKEKI
jgi:hypothetical protein